MFYHLVIGGLLLGSQFSAAFMPPAPMSLACQRRTSAKTDLQMWGNDDNVDGADRFKSCIPYILPILDVDHFGTYLFSRIPPLGMLDYVLIRPLENVYEAVPFGSLIFFLLLTIGTRGNTDMSRSVRFSAQQAAMIDVALILPELIGGAVDGVDVPRAVMEPCSNFVYYTYMGMVIYSIYSNLSGQKPNQIPWISQYAEMSVGPL